MNTSSKNEVADLLIVGAGVAGCAVALACAGKLRRVVMLHAGEDRAGVESLSPDAWQRLKRYSVEVGVSFSTVIAWWGSERVANLPCPGARIVQGDEMAATIRARAKESTMIAHCKLIVALTEKSRTWEIEYREPDGKAKTIAASNVCDATGRRSIIGRLLGSRRRNLDDLCCVVIPITNFKPVGTWTEAVSNGWWNLCSDGKCATLAFYSTPKILRARVGDLNNLLGETMEMQRMVSANDLMNTRVHVCGSSILKPCAGPRWFAVGDAAMTMQPLASAGITKALRDSQLALGVVASDGKEYDWRYQQEFADYAKSLSEQYRLEERWPRSDFWHHRLNDKCNPIPVAPWRDS